MSTSNLTRLAGRVSALLAPFLAQLLEDHDIWGDNADAARAVWREISAQVEARPAAAGRLREIAGRPHDPRVKPLLSWELEKLLARLEPDTLDEIEDMLPPSKHKVYSSSRDVDKRESHKREVYYPGDKSSGDEEPRQVYKPSGYGYEEPEYDGEKAIDFSAGDEDYGLDFTGGESEEAGMEETGPEETAEMAPDPAPPEEAEDDAQRFINVDLTEGNMDQPLPLGQEFTLAFFVGLEKTGVSTGMAFDGARLYRPGEDTVTLHVHLSSQDFIVHTREPQELRLPRGKPSRNKARFDLEPREAGPGEVTALFYKDNNFLQGMTLTLNAAQGEKAIQSMEALGRPVEGVAHLAPRNVLLFIKKAVDGFDMTMVGAVSAQARLPITEMELNQLIGEARSALHEVVWLAKDPNRIFVHPRGQKVPRNVDLVYQTGIDIPAEIEAEALKRITRAGYKLFQKLFYKANAGPDANLLGDRLRELARQSRLKLQIVSEQFLLPWGMLYLGERYDPDNLQADLLLGMSHIVEHIPLQRQMTVLDPRIPSQPPLAVSVNVDQDVGMGLVEEQLNYWRAIHQSGAAQVIERVSDQQLMDAMATADQTPDQILYYYGHATSKHLEETGGPGESSLSFSDRKKLTLDDLETFAPARADGDQGLAGKPLVFINACESAELSPLFYGGFMPYFTSKGARGMIGTECEAPARFAAEWAERFFDRLLYSGQELGEIHLDLRREFYTGQNNLLGLLYALYCDGDTRVEPKLG